jgi:biofilm protein TabA
MEVMIFTSLAHADRYATLHPDFAKCLAYLKTFDPGTPAGRHDIEGTRAYALIQHYETAPAATKRLEAHRNVIDIQFLASGNEIIQTSPPRSQKALTDYDEKDDYQLFDGNSGVSDCGLQAGELAIFFPEDLHKPGCALADQPSSVIKVVVKVPV